MHALTWRSLPWPAVAATGFAALFGMGLYAGQWRLTLALAVALPAVALLLARPVYALALTIALMPLEAVGRIIPGVATLTWSKVALVICASAFAAATLVRREKIHLPAPVWALFGVVAASLAGSALGGFGLEMETLEALAGFASSLALVVLAAHYVRSERDFNAVTWGVVGGSVPVVAFGIVEVVTGQALFDNPMFDERLWAPGATDLFRITSTFYDPNQLARYLCFALLWTLAALGLPSMRRHRTLLALLAGAQAFCLVNTFSRAGFVTLVAVVVPYLAVKAVKRWRAVGVAALAAGGVALVAATWRVLALLLERFDDPTAGGRTGIAFDALLAIAASPLVGFGREHTAEAMGRVWGTPIDPHNLYLETGLAIGAVGLLFAVGWIAPVGARLLRAWRAGDPFAPVVALPLIGVLLFGVSLHGMDGYELWIPFALALPALALSARRQEAAA